MATKTEGYIRELKRLGFTSAKTASRKFLAFQHPELNNLIFVGRRGNLRWGKKVSDSRGIYQPDVLLNNLQRRFIEEVVK